MGVRESRLLLFVLVGFILYSGLAISFNLTIHSPTNTTYGSSIVLFNVSTSESTGVVLRLDDGYALFDTLDNLTFNLTLNVSEGYHNATFIANNYSGGSNTTAVFFSIVLPDTTAPAVTILSPSSGIQSGSRVDFNISLDENGSVAFFEFDGVNYTMSTTNNTYFNYTNASVADGNYTITFYVNDTSGNLNDSESVSIIVETSIPIITISNPTNGSTYTDANLTFVASLNEPGSIRFNISNRPWAFYTMNSSDNLSFFYVNDSFEANGLYKVLFVANDSYGNDAVNVTYQFTINTSGADTTSPVMTVSTPINNTQYNSSNITFFVNLNEQGVVWFNISDIPSKFYFMNSTDNQSFNYTNSSIADGSYAIQFFANDTSNNTVNATYQFSIANSTSFTINSSSSISRFTSNGSRNSVNITINSSGIFGLYNFSVSINESSYNVSDTMIDSISLWNGTAWSSQGQLYLNNTNEYIFQINFTSNIANTSTLEVQFSFFNASGVTLANISHYLYVDSIVIVLHEIYGNYITNDSSYSPILFYYTGFPGENISCVLSLDGVASGTTVLEWSDFIYRDNFPVFNGSWNPGINYYYFICSSINGVVGSSLFNITYNDTTPPTITVVSPVNAATYNESNMTFIVSLDENGTVQFNLSSEPTVFYTMSTSNNTYFTYTNSSIADGTYTVQFIANDSSNNTANTTYSFTIDTTIIDTTNPLVTILSPSSGIQSGASVNFNLSVDENASTALFTLGGVNYTMDTSNNTYFNYTNVSVAQGNYTVTFYVNDTSNNVNDSESVSIIIDTYAPVISTSGFPANNSYILPTQSFTYSVADNTSVTVNSTRNGSTSTLSSTTFTPFSDVSTSATYVLNLTAVDEAGNVAYSGTYTYYVDVTTPAITITTVSSSTPTNFTYNATDAFGTISSIWYEFNDLENTTLNDTVDLQYVNGTLYDAVFPGTHTLVFYVNDTLGNTASTTVYVNVTGQVNLTQQKAKIITNIQNATSSFFLANGTEVTASGADTFNNTDLQNFSFVMSLNQTVPMTINFSGLNGSKVRWNRSFTNATDNNSVISADIVSGFSTQTVSMLYIRGQNNIFPTGSYDYISVLFNISFDNFTNIYYFSSDTINYNTKTDVNQCTGGTYSDGDTLPCWVNSSNQLKVYLSGFSTVFIANDVIGPNISVVIPNATHLQSEFTPTINVTYDTASCTMYYNNTNTNYTGTLDSGAGTCTFTNITATNGFNGTLNFTATDAEGNSDSGSFEFYILDAVNPAPSITSPVNGSTVTTTSRTLSVTLNEKGTVTRSLNGNAFQTCFSTPAYSGSCTLSSLSDGSLNVTINATDLSGNSVLRTIYFTVNLPDEDEDDDSGGSSGGGGGGSSSNNDAALFASLEDDDEDNTQDEVDEVVINKTPKNYQTAIDTEDEFTLRVNDSITVSSPTQLLTFLFTSYDDVRKSVTLLIDGKQIDVSMASATYFDSDGDDVADTKITLKNLAAGLAQLVFSVPTQEELNIDTRVEQVQYPDEDQETTTTTFPVWPVIITSVVVLLILGLVLFVKYHGRTRSPPPEKPPESYPDYAPHEGPHAQDFSANKFMKEEKAQTRPFSVNRFFKK